MRLALAHDGYRATTMSQPLLTYDVDQAFPTSLVRLQGSLTSGGVAHGRNALLNCLAHQPASLLIDVARLRELDGAGAQMLLDVGRRNARWPAATLIVYPVTAPLNEQLRRAGVGRYATLCASELEALARAENEPAPLRADHQLSPGVEAAARARAAIARTCRHWGLPHAISTAQVVASELVNNARRNGSGPLDLTVTYRADKLVISVHDDDPRPPRQWAPLRDADEAGRGLLLLDAFAASWGTLPTATGKAIWAVVPT